MYAVTSTMAANFVGQTFFLLVAAVILFGTLGSYLFLHIWENIS